MRNYLLSKLKIQSTTAANCGHVLLLFTQELFKEKDNLSSLYNEFFDSFQKVEGIVSDRAKEFYAIIALDGSLLEKVLKK